MDLQQHFSIMTQADVESARRAGRSLARTVGFGALDTERVALAVSELATNLLRHAVRGEILLSSASRAACRGVCIESRDAGPGIAALDVALRDGSSTAGSLGCGLGGVQRMMDEMTIRTEPSGTTIVAHKWLINR